MLLLLVQPLCLLPLLFLLSKLEEKKAKVCVSIASLKPVKRLVNLYYFILRKRKALMMLSSVIHKSKDLCLPAEG